MEVTLRAELRTETGNGPARRARASGRIPAVLYGTTIEPQSLFVDGKEMGKALHTEAGTNVLINLEISPDTKFLTVPREIQKHPVRQEILHVDFINVARDVKIHADVPVHLVGQSEGVKEGGQIDQHVHSFRILALPTELPPAIEVDITALGIGDGLKVSDVVFPQGVEVEADPEELVVAVIQPTVMQVEAPVEEGEEVAEGAEGAAASDAAGESASKEDSSG